MRVLHLDLGREMRGGQWQSMALARGQGADAVFMARRSSPVFAEAVRTGLRTVAFSPFELWIAGKRCDVAHAHDAHAHQWMALAMTGPFVVSRRVAFPIRISLLNRWKYSRPAHYIAISEYVRGMLLEAQAPAAKITVVYDGVEIPEIVANPAAERIVLALATRDPMKGTDLVREAASVGGFQVKFTDDLMRDIDSADVFLYVTRSEGLGSAALVAMAHGIPVVASKVGGLPEAVADGVSGVLTSNEPQAIAAAVERARSRRDVLSAGARQEAETRFATKKMIEGTLAVYRKVLDA